MVVDLTHWADASYLIALLDPKDARHKDALRLREEHRSRRLHIHALAIAEVVTLLQRRVSVEVAMTAFFAMKDDMAMHHTTDDGLDAAMDLVERYEGQLSLSDSLFVHLMQRKDAILSFDRDFDGKVQRLS